MNDPPPTLRTRILLQLVLSSYNFKFTFILMSLQAFFTVVFITVVMVREGNAEVHAILFSAPQPPPPPLDNNGTPRATPFPFPKPFPCPSRCLPPSVDPCLLLAC